MRSNGTGVTEGRSRARTRRARDGGSRQKRHPGLGGEALPFHSARKYRIRFHCAEACEPWPHFHGSYRDEPGPMPPSGAPYPGHTAGPVL
jgi:hypothetical protein